MSKYVCVLLSIYYSMFSQLHFPGVVFLVLFFFFNELQFFARYLTTKNLWNLKPVALCLMVTVLLLLCVKYNPHVEMHQTLHVLWLLLHVDTAFLCSGVLFTIQKLREISLERRVVFCCRGFLSEISKRMIRNVGKGSSDVH